MNEYTTPEISIVRGDWLFRCQRHIGLIPADGLGIWKRALFFSLLTWMPLEIWALLNGKAFQGQINEPLLSHFGIHARFLVAIPLMIFGEGMMHNSCIKFIPYFATSGLVQASQRDAFKKVIGKTLALRDSTIPWIVIAAVVGLSVLLQPPYREMHELIWANIGIDNEFSLGFGGWWLVWVSRPIYLALVCVSLWRLVLLFVLFKGIAALDLELVPTHPDHAGGLGFLEKMPMAFSLFVFSLSLVMASRLAHEVIYHGLQVATLKLLVVVFVVVLVILFLLPLLVFMPKLTAAKRRAKLDYGNLVGNHGRLVHRRWVQHETVIDDSLLQAPEIGPVADTLSLYEAVTQMRVAPIGKSAVLSIALPAALPLIALFALQMPVKDILLKILTTIL